MERVFMRIGLFFGRLSNGGGAYQLIHLARTLQQRGHQVFVFSYYQPEPVFAREWLADLEIHYCVEQHGPIIHHDWQPVGLVRFLHESWIMTYRLAKSAERYALDIFQPHEWPFHWSAVLARLWSGRGKIIWMCNDVWHIAGYAEVPESRVLFAWAYRWLIGPLDRWMTRHVDTITVLDYRIQGIVRSYYQHKKVRVVRSGIDLVPFSTLLTKFSAREQLHLPQRKQLWLCLSIFHPHRCFEDVIDAFARLRKQGVALPSLLLVGSGSHAPDYVAFLQQRIFDLDLRQSISIVDRYLSQEEKLHYFAAADGFIFPNDRQTWGLVVIEAMAAELPCIVSSGAGVHEVIQTKKTGLVYSSRNVTQLSRAIQMLLHDHKLRNSIGKAARAEVFKMYSWEKYAEQMEHFFA